MIVNDNIKYIREISELTQAQFSNVFRIPLSSLKNWENTDVMPKVEFLTNLSRVLNIPVDALVNRRLTSNDINWKRLDMEKIVRGEKELDDFIDTSSSSFDSQRNVPKFTEAQNEYIETLKMQDKALTHFRDALKDINDQRMIDAKVWIGRTDELSKRMDRLEAHFDEVRKGLLEYIKMIEAGIKSLSDEYYSTAKETEKDMKEIFKRLDKVDPPKYDNDL